MLEKIIKICVDQVLNKVPQNQPNSKWLSFLEKVLETFHRSLHHVIGTKTKSEKRQARLDRFIRFLDELEKTSQF